MKIIQYITVETKGILPTLLNFGDIHVQSAGETKEFVMRGISNPQKARALILKHSDKTVVPNDTTAL